MASLVQWAGLGPGLFFHSNFSAIACRGEYQNERSRG
jgi:hypothetical protein